MTQVSRPAGFWIRLGALILDGIIIGIPLSLISYLVTGNGQDNWFINIVNILYSILLPTVWYGYVIGKRIVGIRIVKVNGDNVGFGTMLMRVIVAGIVYVLTLGIGVIVSAFMVGIREDKRAIHDFVAGTYVTHHKPGEF